MKILITGAKGFVGKNLRLALNARNDTEVFSYDLDSPVADLAQYLDDCDFVFHLAGVNRPKDPAEFAAGNTAFTEDVLSALERRAAAGRGIVPVMLASSIQAALDNDYGRSKAAAEKLVADYAERTGAKVFVFRFANLFGKWCRANYNSAVATWCHNLARDLPITVRDENATVQLVYIDDAVTAMLRCLEPDAPTSTLDNPLGIEPAYTRSLGEIVSLIRSFRAEPGNLFVPDQADDFARKLYATYLSYLPENAFAYPLVMHRDARGSFTELFRSRDRGQVSVNISRAGITKGQHYHHTKHEKFCVVSGRGVIRFRRMDDANAPVIEYHVSGEDMRVVRIPPGYTHSIVNEGDSDMVTVMWANETFNPAHPDTFREEI